MNVGILVTRFPPDVIGGAELQSQQLAGVLAARGHEVTVFTRRYHGRPYVQRQDGYQIRRRNELPIPGVRMIWDAVPAVWHIARHRPRPQILVCYQTFSSGFLGVLAQTLLGIPAVVAVRGNREYRLGDSLVNRMLVPTIYRRAHRLMVQSPTMLADLLEQFQLAGKEALGARLNAKTTIIPNGIPLNGYGPSRGTKILYVGRLVRDKGVADLLQAMHKLRGVEALIVGDGPERARLRRLACGLPVTFVGQAPPAEISTYLREARVLVLPSHRGDGLPNVILEAMAAGVPVVATRTAGIPDLVQDGETGFLYPAGDIGQLSAHLHHLFQDEALGRRLGAQGRAAVESYSWGVVAPRIEQLLREVTSN